MNEVITADEYFVIYQQFGADRLSVGDTKVTISYSGMKVDNDHIWVMWDFALDNNIFFVG